MKTADILRDDFINYFMKNGFKHMNHSSIVSDENDTTLFTVAGMKQFTAWFKDINLAGNNKNIVTVQPCLRIAGKHDDLSNIGVTTRHNTMFEMLGIFSFGKLTKRETINYLWNFLTEICGINKTHLYVTIYKNDEEAFQIWTEIINPNRIARAEMDTNFWSAGAVGLCGPCSEIFFDKEMTLFSEKYQDVYLEDRFLEICNMVFMSYDRKEPDQLEKDMEKLPCVCIDVGAGLERVASVIDKTFDNYSSSTIKPIIKSIKNISNNTDKRIIADHIRAILFIIANGVLPSSHNQGHILRRLIRRICSFYIDINSFELLDINMNLDEIIDSTIQSLSYYTELIEHKDAIQNAIESECDDLKIILSKCAKIFDKNINEDIIFYLHNTFGMPIEISLMWCKKNNIYINTDKLDLLMKKSVNMNKFLLATQSITIKECYEKTESNGKVLEIFNSNGDNIKHNSNNNKIYIILDKTPFYPCGGGQLGDIGIIKGSNFEFKVEDTISQKPDKNSQTIIHVGYLLRGDINIGDDVQTRIDTSIRNGRTRAHTATHLLCDYLSKNYKVKQSGSKVDVDKLTFDVEYNGKFNDKHSDINKYINDIIHKKINVIFEIKPKNEVKELIEVDKYGDMVRIITIKDNNNIYSRQLCGGTHVKNTADIINFKIISESSIKKNVRRFTCITNFIEEDKIEKQTLNYEIKTYTHNDIFIVECINCTNDMFFKNFDKYKNVKKDLIILNKRESGTNLIMLIEKDIATRIKNHFSCHGVIGENRKVNMGTRTQIDIKDLIKVL